MPGTSDLDQSEPICGVTDQSIPVFSATEILGDSSGKLVRQVREECLGTGFLIIEPTAGFQATIGSTIGQMQSFFSLDDIDPRKQEVRQDETRSGWRPRYTEPAFGRVMSLVIMAFAGFGLMALPYGILADWTSERQTLFAMASIVLGLCLLLGAPLARQDWAEPAPGEAR